MQVQRLFKNNCDNTSGNSLNSKTVMSLSQNIPHINSINSHDKLEIFNDIVGGSTIEIYKLEDLYEVI